MARANLRWAQLVEPARRLAANGFTVTHSLARSLRRQQRLPFAVCGDKTHLSEQRKVLQRRRSVRQPDLAATFARLQQRGPNEFYEGQTARLIVDDMKRHNGLITMADMRGYVAKEREPLRGTYRGYEVISMPPPSSGGAVLIEMLNILEGYDLKKMECGFIRSLSPDDRSDAARVCRSRRVHGRHRFRESSDRGFDR